jgi:hypothetical protein
VRKHGEPQQPHICCVKVEDGSAVPNPPRAWTIQTTPHKTLFLLLCMLVRRREEACGCVLSHALTHCQITFRFCNIFWVHHNYIFSGCWRSWLDFFCWSVNATYA